MMIAVQAAALLTPAARIPDGVVLIEEGKIRAAGTRAAIELPRGVQTVNFGDALLAPGFIDIHVHGGAGHDVMQADPSELARVERLLARHGVTSYYPTTVTAALDDTRRCLERLADAVERVPHLERNGIRAHPLGLHLEGPFISQAKRGVHPPEYILDASLEVFEQLWQAARGHVKVMTVAPEIAGAPELIAECARRGVRISVGHTNADLATARAAVEAGARHATHTFNAMRPLDHREPGVLGAVLADDRMTADMIVDGVHTDPAVVRLFLRAKGEERAVLISDAISATGMPDGRYRLGSFEVEVRGNVCLSAEGKLAGSVLTLDRAVRNVMEFAGWSLERAVPLATRNPARVLGITDRKGEIGPGNDADLVVLTPAGEVVRAIVGGQV